MKRTEPFRKHTQKIVMMLCLCFVDPERSDNVESRVILQEGAGLMVRASHSLQFA